MASIFLLILKRLKTGVQWRELPIESYFEKGEISWQNVYYYFNILNADAGFDSKSLREFLESKEIIANIKPNPRNGEQPDVYFLDITWIGMLLLGFISKSLKKSLNRFF
ncbi:MAG: transposase [Capnocytophaga sp.]|uniref:transposase n=1 Tax=Capnocytophaga sp. TaxID=44737 RepID=UPI003FA095DC